MANPNWQISGQYFETCNCDYLCPCIATNMEARPTKGECIVVLAFHVERGRYGDLPLDNLNFAVAIRTPEEMIKGNWTAGLIVDERADNAQKQALTAIATGQAGGPMAAAAPLISTMAGVETSAMRFDGSGMTWSVRAGGVLDESVKGMTPAGGGPEPMYLDNVFHPVTSRLALAKSTGSHLHAFGLNWDDTSGRNNGHFAPFSWKGS